MNRRIALKLLGAVVVGFAGTWVHAETVKDNLPLETLDCKDGVCGEDSNSTISNSIISYNQGPQDISFGEEGIRNIIVERKNGKVITIPFSEICDALESN